MRIYFDLFKLPNFNKVTHALVGKSLGAPLLLRVLVVVAAATQAIRRSSVFMVTSFTWHCRALRVRQSLLKCSKAGFTSSVPDASRVFVEYVLYPTVVEILR